MKKRLPFYAGVLLFFFTSAKVHAAPPATLTAEVKIATTGKVATVVSMAAMPNQQVFTIMLNNGAADQNLQWVNVTVNPQPLIPAGTTYMIGADEMLRRQGNMVRTQTGQPIRNKDNNMYLMFQNGPADYMLVGVISWRTFLCQLYEENGVVHIDGDGDNKLLKGNEKLPFEKVVCLHDASWQALLDRYADLIVKENGVAKPPAITWQGWATWDYYVQYFLPEDMERNTGIIKTLIKPNIIQIDGGWWKQRGDYFDVRDNIPGGIKAMVQKIHAGGYKAGLHFDGYRVSKSANIVKQHPEYFVHNADGSLTQQGKDPVTKDSLVYWDFSHPGAQQFITDVMKNARENWGVDYFKIDFMRNGLVVKGKSYLPVTNVERYRMGIMAMRKGIQNAYFLACSPNFGVNIGLIEASRTGPDIDPDYEAVKVRAQHNSGSYYFSEKIYNCDPDYLVFRSKAESNERDGKKPSLTYEQAKMWAGFASIFGNVRLQSDELSLLSQEKKELVTSTFKIPFFSKTVPMDLWEHYGNDSDAPNFYLAKSNNGTICLGLFNWGEKDSTFSVSGFKLPASFTDMNSGKTMAASKQSVSVPLKGVQCMLLQYTGKESFEDLRKELMLKKEGK